MTDDIPTPAKGVYIYFDYIALGFVLAAVEELVRNPSVWHVWAGCFFLGAVFLSIGVMGQRMKTALMKRSPWGRLATALKEIVTLKDQLAERLPSAPAQAAPIQYPKPTLGKLTIHSARWVVKG